MNKLNIYEMFDSVEKKEYDSLSSTEARRRYAQIFFKKNFRAFIYLLGYRDLGEFHEKEIKELESQRLIGSKPSRRLWLWSRGHFKTSIITISHTIWLIVNNPNIRLLIVSNTLDVAKKVFSEVRDHFIKNEDFRTIFREFCPKANKEGKIEFGTTEQMTIPNRKRIMKEPTVTIAGIGTNLTTLHFDYMKIDDLVTKDSVTNDTQVQASKDYYASLRQLYDNPEIPREDVVGTIYHFNDLYNSVLKKMPEFKQSIIPARVGDKVMFHERFTQEGLTQILNDPSVGPYTFNCQYLLNPIDPSARKFQDDWITYYDTLPDDLAEHILCDPASSKKATSDFTVIERWGIDKDENLYLIDGLRDKLLANERVDAFVSMSRQCKKLKSARYEVLGGRHGDLENIKDKFIEHRLSVSPRETKSTNASKADRIEQRLTGQFHARKIFLPRSLKHTYKYNGKTYDFVGELLSEYRQFPFSEHDDILDCMSQIFDGEYNARGSTAKIEKNEDNFDWWRKQNPRWKNSQRSNYIFGNKERPLPFKVIKACP